MVNGNLKVLRRHGVKGTRGKYSKGKSIRKRDKSVYSRQKAGHWEADTVVSGQGHKRLNRYESGKDRAQYIKLQNYALDMFGEILQPSWNYVFTAPADIKGYLETYLDWENSVYARLGAIANELDTMGMPCEASLVRKGLPRAEIENVRRMLTEYGLSGWDMSYILPANKKLHNKIKKREHR